jgi:hypothetical protein
VGLAAAGGLPLAEIAAGVLWVRWRRGSRRQAVERLGERALPLREGLLPPQKKVLKKELLDINHKLHHSQLTAQLTLPASFFGATS